MTSRLTKLRSASIELGGDPTDLASAVAVAITVIGGPITLTERTQANTIVGSILLPDGMHFVQKGPTNTFEASANGAFATSVAI